MAFEVEDQINIGEETKGLFRSSSVWMRTYAIIMLVFLGIIGIVLLIVATNKDGRLVAEILSKAPGEVGVAFRELIGAVLMFVFLIGAAMTYGSIKLLKSGNSFTSIAYTGKANEYTKAFKSLKMFWMMYGITICIAVVMGIYLAVRLISIMQEFATN